MIKIFKGFLHNLLHHELVSGGFYVFCGSIVGSFLAFILNLFLARSLSYGEYAAYASLVSVITLATIPSNSINTIIVKFATNFFVKKQNHELKNLYILFLKFILGLSTFIILFFFLISVPLKNYLNIDNGWYVIFSGFVISSFYINVLNGAFLQGLLKFKFIAFTNIIGSITKLMVGILLVFLGFRVVGGLGGLLLMMLVMYFSGFIPLLKIIKEESANKRITLNLKHIFTYAIPTFICILFLTSFISIDVVLVKHFFDSRMAGFYAGLSLMGKAIFYFTGPIPIVMFPLLVKRHAKGLDFNKIFYLALILVTIPSVLITAFYFIFPDVVIKFFLGGREYLMAAPYLGFFGLYLTIYSLVNVCVNFFLALNKKKISIFVALAAILQIILIYIYHSNFYQIVTISITVLSALFMILFCMFLTSFKYSKITLNKDN